MGKYQAIENFNKKVEELQQLIIESPETIVRDGVDVKEVFYANRKKDIPLIGFRSGKLVISGYVKGRKGSLKALIVKCDCGNPEYTVDNNNFHSFKSTKCNLCALKSTAETKKLFWGYADIVKDDNHRVRLLNRISAAITRCGNPNDSAYNNYGGRGIKVFPDWIKDRRLFLAYLITLKGWDIPAYEMDRIDSNKGYEPNNLRFITRSENAMNKRKVPEMQATMDEQADYILALEQQLEDLKNLMTCKD